MVIKHIHNIKRGLLHKASVEAIGRWKHPHFLNLPRITAAIKSKVFILKKYLKNKSNLKSDST